MVLKSYNKVITLVKYKVKCEQTILRKKFVEAQLLSVRS